MCLTLGVTLLYWITEMKLVLSSQCTNGTSVWSAKASIYLSAALVLLISLYMHLIYPSVDSEAIVGWICTLRQIESPRRMNNTWNWPYSVDNSIMIRILMEFETVMGCLVFNLITTPCESDYIWAIIRIRRIKYGFMWATSNILNKMFDTLETSNNRCHIFGC